MRGMRKKKGSRVSPKMKRSSFGMKDDTNRF